MRILRKNLGALARYEQIAVDIADKIARGTYDEGHVLYGRSLLASAYNVSPETIRRALTLLRSVDVVNVEGGKGAVVKSRRKAQEYVEHFNYRRGLLEEERKFAELLEQRRTLDRAIEEQLKKMMSATSRMVTLLPMVNEVIVAHGAPLAGQSLKESNFRGETKATVLSVERKGKEVLAGDLDILIQAEDILIFVGDEAAKDKVTYLATGKGDVTHDL